MDTMPVKFHARRKPKLRVVPNSAEQPSRNDIGEIILFHACEIQFVPELNALLYRYTSLENGA